MDEARLPLTEHLAELRTRIFRILLAWVIGAAAAWSWSEQIFGLLLEPAVAALGEGERTLQAIAPTEIFFTYLKSALLAGLRVLDARCSSGSSGHSSPPACTTTGEKRVCGALRDRLDLPLRGRRAFSATPSGVPAGLRVLRRLQTATSSQSAWTMREVFALTTRLLLAFGTGFELPVIVFFLSMAGVVDAAPRSWRGAQVRRARRPSSWRRS